jgi:hypothetical protein
VKTAAVALVALAVAAPAFAAERADVDAPRLMKRAIETGEADTRTALLITQWVLTARPEEIVPAFVDVLTSAAGDEMKTGDPAWDDAAQATVSAFARLMQDGASHRRPDAAALMQDLAPVFRAAVPAVMQALGEADPAAREAVVPIVRAIAGEAGPAVPVLVEGLKDRDAGVRAASATALGLVGPSARRAVPALTAALADRDARVRDAAADALKRIRQD